MARGATRRGDFPDHATLAVIERFSLHLRRAGALSVRGRPARRAAAAGLDFVGYADHRPGESLRHVDWAVWARSRSLVVRRYADEASGLLLVVVDGSGSMGVGSPSKWTLARGVAAALAHAALGELHQVLVGVLTADGLRALPIGAGAGFAHEVFHFLGEHQPAGAVRLPLALAALPTDGARGDAIIISDFLDPDGPQAALEAVQRQGLRVDAVRVLAPGELTVPEAAVLADPEGPTARSAPRGGERDTLQRRLDGLRDALAPAAGRVGGVGVDLTADAPLAQALETYLQAVQAHRGRQ
ncbi:MAG: DUF58 domain-containing protein [Myxococcales bacterium]|nr:DUF58 domain-containing protein [Myxococcales bacterium]